MEYNKAQGHGDLRGQFLHKLRLRLLEYTLALPPLEVP